MHVPKLKRGDSEPSDEGLEPSVGDDPQLVAQPVAVELGLAHRASRVPHRREGLDDVDRDLGVERIDVGGSTPDGRSATTSQTVLVRTHDVAITKFSAPKAASSGQTRQIVVGINSKRYVETVEVQLLKSVPGGYQLVGSLTQTVPVRPANRTTDFSFSYTFMTADAQVGKVTFKAVAIVSGARDALPADNEAIAPPTIVNR